MTAATPATIDINYILDERSREFYGEGYRWFDLVRTQKWNEYADSYVIVEARVITIRRLTAVPSKRSIISVLSHKDSWMAWK